MVSSKRLYNWYIALVAVAGNVFYGYDNAIFNAMQSSQNWLDWFDLDLKRDSNLIGLVNTIYFVSSIVGGFFIAGPVSDYLGRRLAMHVGYLLMIVAIFMQVFAPHHSLGCFIGGRVVTGLGQGIALTAGPVYMGEVAPSEIRGVLMVFVQLFYAIGSLLTYWVNYGCSMHRLTLGQWDWRLVIIVEVVMPATLMALLPWQPESPRWYLQKNNNVPAARKALLRIRETEQEVDKEIDAIVRSLASKRRTVTSSSSPTGKTHRDTIFRRYATLFNDPSIRKRLILACILNIGQQLTGQGSLNSYSTAIYRNIWKSTTTINLINALNATFGVPFTLNALWTADRFGRRTIFMVGAFCMGLCMLIVPIIYYASPDVDGYKAKPVGIAIVFLLFLFNFFFKPTWGPTTWTWTAEVFPMHVRAQAVGMCTQMQNVANTVFQQFFPTFLNNSGLKSLFFFMSVNFSLIFYVYFFIPETKQVPLEQIDALFGRVDTRTSRDGNVLGRLESQITPLPVQVEDELEETEETDETEEDQERRRAQRTTTH